MSYPQIQPPTPGAPAGGQPTGGQPPAPGAQDPAAPGAQDPAQPPAAGQQAPGAPAQQPPAQQQPPSGQQGQQGQAQDVSSLPEWAQKLITDTRAEAARHRTEKNQTAQQVTAEQGKLNAVLKALGINANGEQVTDPQAMADEFRTELWSTKVDNGVITMASEFGLDAKKVTDSVRFWQSLDSLADADPRSPEFGEALKAKLTELAADPYYKAAPPVPTRSGGEFPGGPGSPASIDQQIEEATKARDFNRAIGLKRQRAAMTQQ